MKHRLLALIALLLPLLATAQEYSSSFNALRLPVSAHIAALGGHSVALVEDDPAAGWSNPALYANASDLSLGLNFMTYPDGGQWLGANFSKAFGERHTLAVGAQLLNYGSMDETDELGNVLGTFHAKDITVGAGYSYLLSDRWTGGANLKFLFSNLADYSSIAFAVDLGLNYYDEDRDLSLSAALQNMGTQLKAYDNGIHTHLPFTLALGFSMGMAHLPVRFHVTMTDVTRWRSSYYALTDADTEKISFSRKALNHFVVGLDVLPTSYLTLSLGYNFRRASELKASGSSALAGLSAGAGVNLKRLRFGLTYARYHRAASSIMATAGYRF